MNVGTLKAQAVCKAYGEHKVLKDLDLTLEPGRIYGLIGRNGVGKTTLLGILTAQNTLDSGSVTYDGQPVWENQSVLDHLCFSRELNQSTGSGLAAQKVDYLLKAAAIFYPGWDRDYAQRLMEEFKLDRKKKISQLSKGQASSLTILLALASRAPVTILDEPTAGLDVVARERFYQLVLEDYAETGRTFVISTHIIEEAASIFERVLILDKGRIIEDAPTEELVDQFRTVSGREDVVDQATRGMNVLSVQQLGRRKTVAVRADGQKLAALEGADLDVAPMNLQNVFVALCGHGDEK